MFTVAVLSSVARILSQVQWRSASMVTRYDVISKRWSSHFWVKVHVFSTFCDNKSKSWGENHAKCLFVCYFSCQAKKSPFLVVLPWFRSLGEIQDGDHCWWRHRPPAVPPLIKYSLSHREDQRLSTEGKIVSEYSNIPKPLGGFHLLPPPPPFTTLVGLCKRAPPMDNFNVFISRTIVRWWDTTRPAPGLSWSTGATKATTQRQSKPEQTPSVS